MFIYLFWFIYLFTYLLFDLFINLLIIYLLYFSFFCLFLLIYWFIDWLIDWFTFTDIKYQLFPFSPNCCYFFLQLSYFLINNISFLNLSLFWTFSFYQIFFCFLNNFIYILIFILNSFFCRLLRSHISREFREQFDSGLIQYLTGETIRNIFY